MWGEFGVNVELTSDAVVSAGSRGEPGVAEVELGDTLRAAWGQHFQHAGKAATYGADSTSGKVLTSKAA